VSAPAATTANGSGGNFTPYRGSENWNASAATAQRLLSTCRRTGNASLERLAAHRFPRFDRYGRVCGGVLPDTDDIGGFLDPVASCLFSQLWKSLGRRPTLRETQESLDQWLDHPLRGWGPDTSTKLRRDACEKAITSGGIESADECAREVRLSYDERTLLGIKTIGACDADKEQRKLRAKERKRKRDKLRARAKRAERGANSREEYLRNSLSTTKPWIAERIWRATWYRRHAGCVGACGQRETSASQAMTSMLGDGLVSTARTEQPSASANDASCAHVVTRDDASGRPSAAEPLRGDAIRDSRASAARRARPVSGPQSDADARRSWITHHLATAIAERAPKHA
jgi:hypothetical protein